MSPKSRTQAPIVRPLPSLADRELRFAPAWRTVALLADQAAEITAKYPESVTARKFNKQFKDALEGLLLLHKEFWESTSLSDTAAALEADKEDERAWLKRNHISA